MKKPKPIFIIVLPIFETEEEEKGFQESKAIDELREDYHVVIVQSANVTDVTYDVLNCSLWDHVLFWIGDLFKPKVKAKTKSALSGITVEGGLERSCGERGDDERIHF